MSYNTIKIKKYSDVIEEYAAAAAIIPGMLIELTTDNTVKAHATSGGNVLPMFALEDELQGRGIDTSYAAAEKVQCWIPNRGDVVLERIGSIVVDLGDVNRFVPRLIPHIQHELDLREGQAVDIRRVVVEAFHVRGGGTAPRSGGQHRQTQDERTEEGLVEDQPRACRRQLGGGWVVDGSGRSGTH